MMNRECKLRTSETGTVEGTMLPAAPSASTRRRIVVKSEPVAVNTQEAVDGHCEKSDGDRECRTNRAGQRHGAVNHGSGAQVGKAIEPLWRSVVAQSGWMELEESQPPDSDQALAREISTQHAGRDDQGK